MVYGETFRDRVGQPNTLDSGPLRKVLTLYGEEDHKANHRADIQTPGLNEEFEKVTNSRFNFYNYCGEDQLIEMQWRTESGEFYSCWGVRLGLQTA